MLYFIPLLLSSAAIAITYKALLDPNFGLGAGPAPRRCCPRTGSATGKLALGVVIFVVSWQFIPFHSLIYQGAVRQIPRVDVRGGRSSTAPDGSGSSSASRCRS